MPPIQFLIDRRDSGKTVAEVLRVKFRLTWSQAKRVVERGQVRLAGQLTRAPEQRVKAGNRFWVAAGAVEAPPPSTPPPRPRRRRRNRRRLRNPRHRRRKNRGSG